MKSILLREIKSFFGSVMGYLVIVVFLVLNGLFLWGLNTEFNILQSGFSDMSPFFKLSPWILLFLIPAVTMKSFSEELKQGTIELLLTKPLTVWQIVLGKFMGAFVLFCIAILPTVFYVLVLSEFSLAAMELDYGNIMGSYFGLLFLASAYTSIGVFSSVLSENQIVAFIIAVLLCLFFFVGLEELSKVLGNSGLWIEKVGISYRFKSMSRGVIDTRDLLYFLSFSALFLGATVFKLKMLKK